MTTYHLPESRYRRRASTEALIIHHSQGPARQTVDEIRGFHTRSPRPPPGYDAEASGPWRPGRGWLDIGYNWVVRKGIVFPGRPHWAAGAHAPGWNTRSEGICLIGDYSTHGPPDPQWAALVELVRSRIRAQPDLMVLGHREAMDRVGRPGHTSCPGALDMDELRAVTANDCPGWGI